MSVEPLLKMLTVDALHPPAKRLLVLGMIGVLNAVLRIVGLQVLCARGAGFRVRWGQFGSIKAFGLTQTSDGL